MRCYKKVRGTIKPLRPKDLSKGVGINTTFPETLSPVSVPDVNLSLDSLQNRSSLGVGLRSRDPEGPRVGVTALGPLLRW